MKKISTLLLSGTAAFLMANGQTAYAACSPFPTGGDDNITCTGLSAATVTGNGNDTVTHNGTLLGLLGMGSGNDTFYNNSGTITSATQGTGNDDAIINAGTIVSLDQGANDDDVIMSGGLLTLLNQQGGVDTVDVSGGLIASMFQGDGNDTLTTSGTAIMTFADQGANDDTLNVNGGSAVSVFQGSGSDTANITAGTAGVVFGEDGDDDADWSGGNLLSYFGGDGSDELEVTAATYDGSQLLNGGDDLSSGDGFVDTLTLDGLNVTIFGPSLVNWENINVAGSTIAFSNGAVSVGSDPGNGMFLYGNSLLDGQNALAVTGNLDISSNSTFDATGGGAGVYSVSGNLSSLGMITMQDAAAGDRLSVGGNLVGGGTVALDVDTALNTNDQLSVTGDVLGLPVALALNNTGATGSYTGDGPGAGLALVTVGGTTDAADFALAGGPLIAGAFAYDISLEADNTWYLQSTARAGAVAALTAGSMAGTVGTTFLGTYHERTGEQERNPNSNVWGRVVGTFGNESVKAAGIGDVETAGATVGLQAGLDIVAHENASGGRTRLGLYGGLASSSGDVTTAGAGGASGLTEGEGKVAGVYASHVAANWYADAVLQGQWLDVDASGGATTLATDAQGWLASLEVGHSLALTETASLEPQAQFIMGSNSTDAATDSDGVLNSWSDDDIMLGRIGARLKSAHTLGNGAAVSGWLKANLWTDFKSDDQSVTMASMGSSSTTALDGKKTWVDFGIGFDVQASSNIAFFVDGDMAVGLSGDYQAFNGKAGMKVDF